MEQWIRVVPEEALRTASDRGYTGQFLVTKKGLLLRGVDCCFQASEFHIDDFVLLEDTDSSRIALLYITTYNNYKGVLII